VLYVRYDMYGTVQYNVCFVAGVDTVVVQVLVFDCLFDGVL